MTGEERQEGRWRRMGKGPFEGDDDENLLKIITI
jgi:hypothetical protein